MLMCFDILQTLGHFTVNQSTFARGKQAEILGGLSYAMLGVSPSALSLALAAGGSGEINVHATQSEPTSILPVFQAIE